MELPDESKIKLAKLQLEHNRIIWDQINIGIKQLILYSDSLFPSIKNQTTFKGINFAKLKSPILKRYMDEGGDEYGNPFEPNIIDKLLGGFSEDDIVQGSFGWQEYAISGEGSGFMPPQKLPEGISPTSALSIYGITGLTAYFGMLDIGKPVENDTVLISGAAGATGSVAGQIARIKGASNIIGIAGGPEKCKWVVEEAGFDSCIDYKSEDVAARITELAPKGLNIYFDNVGGPILEYALGNIAQKARVVMCGGISSGYTMERLAAGPSTIFNLIIQRGKMEGFIVIDYAEQFPNAIMELAGWVAEGKITYKEDIAEGLENCPETLANLFKGKNFGKQLLKLSD